MTVNNTPRLGLMSPADSDTFSASDFATTFGILDDHPGIAQVDTYFDLVTLGNTFDTPTNQHGLLALDRSSGALWWWNAPGHGVTPGWDRANSVGRLASVSQFNDVTTSATTGNGVPIFDSALSATLPGGRTIRVDAYVNCTHDNSNPQGGAVVLNLMMDSLVLRTAYFRVAQGYHDSTDGSGALHGTDCFVSFFVSPTSFDPDSNHTFNFRIRSAAQTSVAGTAGARSARMTIIEV